MHANKITALIGARKSLGMSIIAAMAIKQINPMTMSACPMIKITKSIFAIGASVGANSDWTDISLLINNNDEYASIADRALED